MIDVAVGEKQVGLCHVERRSVGGSGDRCIREAIDLTRERRGDFVAGAARRDIGGEHAVDADVPKLPSHALWAVFAKDGPYARGGRELHVGR